MNNLTRFRNLWLVTAGLVAALSGIATGAPLAPQARREILSADTAQLEARKADLQSRARIPVTNPSSVEIEPLKGKGAKASRLRFVDARGKKSTLLLRAPGRGASWGAAANETMGRLAALIGKPAWVPAAILVEPNTFGDLPVPRDTGRKDPKDIGKTMVMEYLPGSFKDGEDAPLDWLRNIKDRDRVKAALLDVLALSRDRKLTNVMANEEHELGLIDHDVTFGMKAEKGPHFPSAFWKGQSLGYRSKQARFEDLPTDTQPIVQAIAEESDLEVLGQAFPLARTEKLEELRRMARAIVAHGLDGAVERIIADSTAKGFIRADDTANAARLLAQ